MSSSSSDACNAQYLAQISQRTQLQLFQGVVPPVRLDLGDENPYASGQWTSGQLAMRRKFNILQYPGTAISRGSATAARQYLRLVRGGSVVAQRVAQQSLEDARFSVCDVRNPISVGSSGVPHGGDTDVLFLDPAVPLYMSKDPRLDRNYIEFADIPADPFAVYYAAQTPVLADSSSSSSSIWATVRLATRTARLFRMRLVVPLAVVVSGTTATGAAAATVEITVAPRTIHLYYNDTPVVASLAPAQSLVLALQVPGGGGVFSAAMYVETLVADLPVFWASDVIAVLTARVHAQTTFTPPPQTNMTATVVAHLPPNWTNTATGGASLTSTPPPPALLYSSSVVLLDDDAW